MTIDSLISVDQYVLTFFNDSHSLFLDSMVPMLTSGITWIPLYIGMLYLVVKNNETMPQIGLIVASAFCCIIFAGGVDDFIVKPLVARPRPCNDPSFKYLLDIIPGTTEQSFSFFSAHAANTMSLACFFSLVVRDRLLTATIFAWSLLNCWTRLYLGVHYPSDVIVGIIYGILVGSVVYFFSRKIYYKFNPKITYISTQYTSTGYSKDDISVLPTIVVITIAVIIIGALTNLS